MANEEISVRAFFAPVRKRLRLVVFGTLGVVLVAIVYNVVRPAKWEATAVILISPSETAAGSLARLSTDVATPLTMMHGVLENRSAQDMVLDKMKIDRKELKRVRTVSIDPKKNQLTISVVGQSKERILGIAQASLDALNEVNRTVGFTMAQAQARYLETAVKEKEKDLREAALDLAAFQRNMKTAAGALDIGSAIRPSGQPDMLRPSDPQTQLRSFEFELKTVQKEIGELLSNAKLNAKHSMDLPTASMEGTGYRKKIEDLQFKINVAKLRLAPENPQYKLMLKELSLARAQYQSEIDKQLRAVELNVDSRIQLLKEKEALLNWQVNYLRGVARIAPGEAIELQGKLAELKTREAVLETVRQQYEKARIDAEVERVRWGLLTKPSISDEPINKDIPRSMSLGFVVGLFGSVLLAFVLEVLRPKSRETAAAE